MVEMTIVNLVTTHGELDLNFTPSGATGYEDLHAGAITFDVSLAGPVGREQLVAAIMAMAEAAMTGRSSR